MFPVGGPHSERCLFCRELMAASSESTRRRVTGSAYSQKKKNHLISFSEAGRCSLAASTRSERVNTRFHLALNVC